MLYSKVKCGCVSALILSFILLGCSSNEQEIVADGSEIVIDEHKQIVENCNVHLERMYEIGTDISTISPEQFNELQMMNDHVLAVKSKYVKFLRPDTTHLKSKADIEFSSAHESELYDCIKNLDRKIKVAVNSI